MRTTLFLIALVLPLGVGLASSEARASDVHVTWSAATGLSIFSARDGHDAWHWRARAPYARDYERRHRLDRREIRWHVERIEELERRHRKLNRRIARSYRKGRYHKAHRLEAEAWRVRRELRRHRRAYRRAHYALAEAQHQHSPRCNH